MTPIHEMTTEQFTQHYIDLEVKRIIKKDCETYGKFKTTETIKEVLNEFTFVVTHTNIETSKKQHRYNIIAFYGTEVIYKDSNIIDRHFYKSIDELKTRVKNHFKRISEKLYLIN